MTTNRYKMHRYINDFILKLCHKYGLSDGFKVKIRTEKHIADRILDRDFPKETFQILMTRMVRFHICEIMYLSLTGVSRINIYTEDGYMMGITGKQTPDGFVIAIRTLYKERNFGNRKRIIDAGVIYTINRDEERTVLPLTEQQKIKYGVING